jgi:hypothetical protein
LLGGSNHLLVRCTRAMVQLLTLWGDAVGKESGSKGAAIRGNMATVFAALVRCKDRLLCICVTVGHPR